jgi:predicted phosphodiesterase
MTGLTWLHLSDWQQRDKDFKHQVISDALFEDIRNRATISRDLAKVDFIVFSGDLTYSGRAEEYKLAKEQLLAPLLEEFKISSDKLFFVPGNHDMDRTKKDFTEVFRTFTGFVTSYTGQEDTEHVSVRRWQIGGKKIALLGINFALIFETSNSMISDPNASKSYEKYIRDRLDQISDAEVKIAVIHNLPSGSNKNLENFLVEWHLIDQFNFFLHSHQNNLKIQTVHTNSRDCIIIPAGVAYNRNIEDPLYGSYNFAHLEFDSGMGTIYLRRFNALQKKWEEDNVFYPDGRFEFILPLAMPNDPSLQEELQKKEHFKDAKSNDEKMGIPSEASLDSISITATGSVTHCPPDRVSTWKDSPLQNPDEDLLGRDAFAGYICKLIKNSVLCQVCNGEGCTRCDKTGFSKPETNHILLYGHWGAGKSTVLNFLTAKLDQDDKWLVAEFNAWQNQHVRPPWWSLMDCIFQKAIREKALNRRDKLRENFWRLGAGRMQYLYNAILLVLLMMVLAIVAYEIGPFMIRLLPNNQDNSTSILHLMANNLDDISKIITAVVVIMGAICAAIWTLSSSSLLLGSYRAAQNYTELTNDPMNKIKEHFEILASRIHRKHIVVLIDDLDRCQSSYVVELLEGIQTLFYQAPVIFVVAADRRWLNICYEQVYEKLNERVNEPGKSLGTLFLEKIFHFSTPMPGITTELKQRYWKYLLHVKSDEREADLKKARQQAKELVSKEENEEDVRHLVDNLVFEAEGENTNEKKSFIEQRAIREEAVLRLAEPKILNFLEHALMSYAHLLDPNPRSMKLLVNAYSANRVLAFLSEVKIDRSQLVLWTVISLRWPMLTDYLEGNPNKLDDFGKEDVSDIPDALKSLFRDTEICNIIKGKNPLEVETIKKCAQLHA